MVSSGKGLEKEFTKDALEIKISRKGTKTPGEQRQSGIAAKEHKERKKRDHEWTERTRKGHHIFQLQPRNSPG
jgi:hypothetical protein